MQIALQQGNIAEQKVDLIVVNLFAGTTEPDGATRAVDAALGGRIRAAIHAGDLGGKAGESLLLDAGGGLPARRVLVMGLGEQARFSASVARTVAAATARRARELGARTVATILHGAGSGGLDLQQAAQALTEGTQLGIYRFRGYRSSMPRDWQSDPTSLTVVEQDATRLPAIEAGLRRGATIALGVKLARDVVNEPANHMTPTTLAAVAGQLADDTGLRMEAFGRERMAELGMGILLAVAAGSEQPPQFIILEHNAGRDELPTVVLAGKGVTFDSGGISIKPSEEMWRMKGDMAGGAAVIGALGVAARLQVPLHVVGLVPCAENLPGGNAQKPGDVFTGLKGKTMEVISTDAEGRMLLADALAYAERFRPAAVIDIATLTGAQSIALGPLAAGFFANDESLAARLAVAAEASGERLWRLPLYEEYGEAIKSQVADVKNSVGRYGGIGTSAKFLEHFTEGYPWAHIDMASMSLADDDRPWQPKGATGYGVRLFTALLENWGAWPG